MNTSNGAVLDAAGDLEAIDSTAIYIAYRHVWNSKMRSNISYSAIEIDNDLTGTGVTDSTESGRVNLFYSSVNKLSFCGEVAIAKPTIMINFSSCAFRGSLLPIGAGSLADMLSAIFSSH